MCVCVCVHPRNVEDVFLPKIPLILSDRNLYLSNSRAYILNLLCHVHNKANTIWQEVTAAGGEKVEGMSEHGIKARIGNN